MKRITHYPAIITALFLMAGHSVFAADTQIGAGFNGPKGTDTWWWPNDPNAAVGPRHVMVLINGIYRIYTKAGVQVGAASIDSLFSGTYPGISTLDPNITYDDIAQRFVIEANGSGSDITSAYVAVSNSSDPTQGFTEIRQISFPGAWDGSKLGFNAEVYVVCATTGTAVIEKASMLDANNATFTLVSTTTSTYGRAARMHGAPAGAPIYFMSGSGGQVRVTRMSNVLSATPTYTSYIVGGSSGCSDPCTAEWRSDSLVTANTGSTYWWQVNTAPTTPTLTQQGLISPRSGYSHAYGSASIAPNGDIAVSYLEQSANTTPQPVSMWVAWRAAGDAPGTIRTPIMVATSGDTKAPNGRHGDYSSTVCDISTNGTTLNTFWSCNGYIRPNGSGTTEAVWLQPFGGALVAPAITAHPQSVTVTEGSPITLSVSGTGAQPFQYQWRNGGMNLAGATNNPFTLPATTLTDAGNYTVVLSNSIGSVTSAVATVTIIPAYNGVWINASGGSWTNTANWSGGVVATGIGKTANLGTLNITGNPNVTLDGSRTIGGLIFGDTTPSHHWMLSTGTGGTLTLDNLDSVPTVTVNNQSTMIGASLAGTEGMTKAGAGTLILTNFSALSGGLTVTAGTLSLNTPGLTYNNTGGGGGGAISVNPGATLTLANVFNAGYNRSIVINGGTLNSSSGTASDGNQYINNLTLNSGAVVTGNPFRSGFHSDANINVGGTSASTISSGLLLVLNGTYQDYFNVADVTGSADPDLTISGAIRDLGGYAGMPLVKSGAGTMSLTAANSYIGGTTISAGTLMLGVGGSIASSTPITISPGAVLDVSAAGSFTLGSGKVLKAGRPTSPATDVNGSLSSAGSIILNGTLTLNGGLTLTGGTLTCDFSPGSSDLISLTGANRTLTLAGTTTITPASGYYANGTYTLVKGHTSASGSAANFSWGGTPGSNIRGTPVAAFSLNSTNASVTISGGTPVALSWKGTSSSAWDINTTSNWQNTVPAADIFFNLDTVTFGDNPTTTAVTLAAPAYPGTVTFNNTTASTYTFSGAGAIAGSTSVSKTSGNGTVNMNLTNTYAGGTTISAGTISLGNNGNEVVSGLGVGPVTVNTGGTLKFAPGSTANPYYVSNPIALNGGVIWVEDGKQHLSGSQVNVGPSGGTLSTKWGAKDLWIDSQLTGSGPLTINHTPGGDGGTTGVHFSNPANTYSGIITVNNSTTPAQVANTYALSTAVLNLTANNTLIWDGVTNIVLGGLSGSGSINNSGNALTVGYNNGSTTYSGVLSGSGWLTKAGAGVFTVSGANTYTGSTDVRAGTLQVNGSLAASSTVTVAGGTLAGTGTIYGGTSIESGGTLAPGNNGIGLLTVNNTLTLSGGSTSRFEISKNGSLRTNDIVSVTGTFGTLTQAGTLIVTNIGPNALAAGDSFKLFNATDWSGYFTNLVLPTLTSGLSWNTNTLASNGTLAVVVSAYTLSYNAGAHGTISGTTPQTVNHGASGTAVAAVPDSGYVFTNWSDGLMSNPRTDVNVTNNIAVTANFVTSVNTTAPDLVAVVNGSNLDLSWPADRTGWQLQIQTNVLTSGLGTNWAAWPGSTTTNRVTVPINAVNPSVFLRLVYPPQP